MNVKPARRRGSLGHMLPLQTTFAQSSRKTYPRCNIYPRFLQNATATKSMCIPIPQALRARKLTQRINIR